MRCATVVITLAATCIMALKGAGSSAAPAANASLACCASSVFICATMARLGPSFAGSNPGGFLNGPPLDARFPPQTLGSCGRHPAWRPRSQSQTSPAYQSGLSKLGRPAQSSCRRCSHQAKWSVSSLQAAVRCWRSLHCAWPRLGRCKALGRTPRPRGSHASKRLLRPFGFHSVGRV